MSELSELPSEECSSSESVFVGYRQELVRNRKTKYNVNGRDIVIFYLNGNFHAMDQRCYRKYWKSALIFTQNLLDSHCSVALTIDTGILMSMDGERGWSGMAIPLKDQV